MFLEIFLAGGLAFFISWLMTLWLAAQGNPLRILDSPNDRSLHSAPTPRTGGLAVLAAGTVAWLVIYLSMDAQRGIMLWIAGAASFVVVVSLLDDIMDVSPWLRLLVHGVAAAVLLNFIKEEVPWPWFLWVAVFLAVIWMINLYNFMDGMDGFAGGMGLFGFGFLALAAWRANACWLSGLALAFSAANGGFLLVNFPPARIFMGDAGSATMGFMAAALALLGIQEKIYPFWLPVLIFSPFIVDATFTLLRRLLRGEKVWQAHRSHFYQRLVQMGWGHRKTVLVEYILMLAVGISTVVLQMASIKVQMAGLIAWTLIYAVLARTIYWLERRSCR